MKRFLGNVACLLAATLTAAIAALLLHVIVVAFGLDPNEHLSDFPGALIAGVFWGLGLAGGCRMFVDPVKNPDGCSHLMVLVGIGLAALIYFEDPGTGIHVIGLAVAAVTLSVAAAMGLYGTSVYLTSRLSPPGTTPGA